ncbi:VOC family protein [Carnobacterium sp.]|uniref:VOC family protein n=1 Tax=Carnobacterium sp. TaxID=48221 RepID=UPI0028AA3030|nr:VOC family protein [Carnobacterium sp.]
MTNKITIMLYVENVEENASFWKHYFKAEEVARVELGASVTITLALSLYCHFQLFDNEFIRKHSPEVADNKPSILIDTPNFEEIHDQLEKDDYYTGEYVYQGNFRTFNFRDNVGNYYAVREMN